MKRARIMIESVSISCPHCGAEQPEPDQGSLLWTREQLHTYQGRRRCDACGRDYQLTPRKERSDDLRD
jgi:hypothetical protein